VVEAGAIRVAAEEAGLVLGDGVYANVAAALAAGRHVLLSGAAGSGKTTLALAVARAAARAGKAEGAVLLPAGDPALDERIVEAARRGRWAVVDELEGAEAALGSLSAFLGGFPVTLPGGDELTARPDWRIVATSGGTAPWGAALRRFAAVELGDPPADALERALRLAAGADEAALAAVRELGPLGAGVLLAAARHAAARNAAAPTDAATLARELHAAYVVPLLDEGR
jgi:MoxR-like ATPase